MDYNAITIKVRY